MGNDGRGATISADNRTTGQADKGTNPTGQPSDAQFVRRADCPMVSSPFVSLPAAVWAASLLIVAGLGVIWAVGGDYGIGWDEAVHSRYAELVIDYFASGGTDTACNEYRNLKIYGPTVDLAAAVVSRWIPADLFYVRHVLSALLALATVPALVWLGRLYGDAWMGVLAGLGLLLMPRFFGHAFINDKDIPFACFFAWSMASLCSLFVCRSFRWREFIGCGLAMGLMTAVRPGGWVMLALFIPAVMLLAGRLEPGRKPLESNVRFPLKLAVMFAVAWLTMIAPWPWAHENVILHPLLAIRSATAFQAVMPVLFEGAEIASDRLPRYYLLKYVAITTPPAMLAIAVLGNIAAVREQLRNPRTQRTFVLLVMQLWLFAPLAMWTLLRPNIYDGLRHFLFVLPALALWFGVGGRFLIGLFERPRYRFAAACVVTAAVLSPIPALVRLHPYQMTYFNAIVGGTKGADGRYETDYWATSYREAMQWINHQAQAQPSKPVRILVAANDYSWLCADHYRGPGVDLTFTFPEHPIPGPLPAPFDFYLATYRNGKDDSYAASPIVQTIGRDGAVFAVIRSRHTSSTRAQ